MIVVVTIDTEEDNWDTFRVEGATVRNVENLPLLQEVFDRYGARPTYLVNHAPLVNAASVEVLAELAARGGVEIGAHCHPWNTPPDARAGADHSMMCNLPVELNRAKIREITRRVREELGVESAAFRSGRWGFGPTVAEALAAEGYRVDCSVSPFMDWSKLGGPDYGMVPNQPYRFDPEAPLVPNPDGLMLELPTTVGFLRGHQGRRQRLRRWLERGRLAGYRMVGILDRGGLLTRRWLSPEHASSQEMIRLADHLRRQGRDFLSLTFHSGNMLPGATPFVRTEADRERFLGRCAEFLAFLDSEGYTFATVSEAAEALSTTVPERI